MINALGQLQTGLQILFIDHGQIYTPKRIDAYPWKVPLPAPKVIFEARGWGAKLPSRICHLRKSHPPHSRIFLIGQLRVKQPQ